MTGTSERSQRHATFKGNIEQIEWFSEDRREERVLIKDDSKVPSLKQGRQDGKGQEGQERGQIW